MNITPTIMRPLPIHPPTQHPAPGFEGTLPSPFDPAPGTPRSEGFPAVQDAILGAKTDFPYKPLPIRSDV